MRIKLGKLLAVVLAACMTLSSVSLSALMDPDKLPANGGELANYSYTLTDDIDLTGGYIVTHDVTIDLNGHTIKNVMEKTRVNDGDLTMFTVRYGAHLIINDSSAKDGMLDQNSKNDRTIRVDGNGYMDSSTNQWVNSAASSLTINGGQFVNSTDGVVYASGYDVVVTLNDGLLQNNTTPGNGGAICVDGGGTFIMNGGTVDHNESTGVADANGSWGHVGGGGIYVGGNMTMSGGTVSNNIAGAGGGIFANSASPWGQDYFNTFEMTGGVVTGNVANQIEGGGVRIGVSVDATFHAASGKTIEISGNQTTSDTDWGGGGIFITEGGKATMYDTLITGNTADGFGGGLTGCPTAHNYVMSTDGAAIFGNTAKGTQDVTDSTKLDSAFSDAVFTRPGKFYQDYFCNLKSIISDTMLGGGSERWEGTIDSVEVKFGPGETRISSSASGLTAYPTDADMDLARSRAEIYVQNNHSDTHGGGILNNGMLFFGETPTSKDVPTYLSIPVEKNIDFPDENYVKEIKDKFKFIINLIDITLKNKDGTILEQADEKNPERLSALNDGTYRDPEDGNTKKFESEDVTITGEGAGRFDTIIYDDTLNDLPVNYVKYNRDDSSRPAGNPDYIIKETSSEGDVIAYWYYYRTGADNVKTYTYRVVEFEESDGKSQTDNKNEYELDKTEWRVEVDVASDPIYDEDITKFFNLDRYITVRDVRIYRMVPDEVTGELKPEEHEGETITTPSFTNRLKTGGLKVEKKTVIKNENDVVDNYETEDEFSFTVTLEPALNGTFGDMTFENGVATFELGNGEHKTAAGLPIGVHYTVTEADNDNDKYSSEITGASGDIVKDTTATVTATNTVKTGSLSITKTLVGNAPGTDTKEFKFTVTGPDGYNETVTVKGADTVTLNNLAIGEYTVTEQDANIDGYALVVTGSGTTQTVTVDKVAEFDITNEYTQKLGSLKIVKSVVGGGEEAANKTFTFTVTGTNYSKTVTITGNGEKKLDNLVPGEYTVTEQNADIDGYTLEVSGNTSATVTAEKVANATITNTYTQKPGSLKIVKSVVGGGDEAANKTFTFTVTGPNGYNETVTVIGAGEETLNDLVPGEYTVTEQNADIDGYTLTVDGEGKATVSAEEVANVTIVNTYTQKPGSLKITKTLKGEVDAAKGKTFSFTITGESVTKNVTVEPGKTVEVKDLVPGTYTITETGAEVEGYTLTVTGIDDPVTVAADQVTEVNVTNTYTQKPGSLKIVKSVEGGGEEAANKTFTFTVTGPDGYNETVTIIGEGEETLNDLVPGEYTVTEQDANIDGYTLEVTGNGETKTVTADQVAEFDITNTYTQKPGSLKIVKSVEGGGDEAANKTFTFTVTGTNYSNTVTITGNGYAELENLVPGEYTVTENKTSAQITGYTLAVTGEGKATVSAEDVANVTIVNTYTQKPGSLKIVKSVVGGGDEAAGKTFTFTVTGTNYSKTVTITGNGETKLDNLVPGEYKITETGAEVAGYTLTVTGIDKPVTVVADQVTEVNVTNDYTQKLGSLKIVKSVEGGGDEAANKTFTFTVTGTNYSKTVTITGNGYAELENLVPGTYTVTEDTASAEVEGYTLTVTGDNSTATIAADGNAEVTITNNYTRKVGDLSVTKTLAGPVTDEDMAGSYNITVTLTNADGSPYSGNYTLSGAEYEYSGPISLVFSGFTSDSKNKTIQISGLPVGTRYTVTETAVDETFNVSYTAVTGDGVVTADSVSGSITEALSMATVTNTKKETERFALNVTKTVEGAAPAEPFKFNVTFYIKTAEGITAPAGAVLGADGAGNITYAFEIPANTTVSFTGVPKGTYYEITEAPAEGYTLINQSLTSGTLLGNAEATFVNKENVRGSLSIVKELIGEGNALNAYNVNVTLTYPDERGVVSEVVTLMPGMPKIYEDLPVGTAFEVSETAESADGYNVSVSINGGGYVPGATATGTVTETAPVVSVAVRNEKEAPKESSLTVVKTVRGDNIDPTRAFNFTVTLTDTTINGVYGEMEFVNGMASFALAGGQSRSADKLPEGIGYTVKELDENLDGYTTEYPANATGILSSDSSAIVEVINTTSTLPGSLSVTKQVTGDGAEMGRTFMFTVMLNDPTITGQYGDMYFNGGVATIYLAHGMRATATGLPAGVGYNVIENDYGDYIPQAINPTGVIPDNGSAEVVYINHRDEQLGSLSVSKTVEGEGYDPEQEFIFTVTVNDPTVNGRYGDMFFSGGVATLTLKAGRTATATNLPADTGYTVTEAPVENYTSAATGDVGIIPAGNGAYAQFVNTYEAPKVGGFSLMKIVSGTAADPNRYFTFQVILSDATINGVYGDLAFADGFSTVFLRHGDIVYCDNLPEGTGYTVIELDADDYEVSCNAPAGTIVSGETGEIIFENHKDVPPPPPPPEIPENEENPHGDDMNAGVGGDRDRHGDDMNAGVGMDDMNPATGDFMSESFMNGMAMLSAIVAAIAAFGAAVLIRKRKKD